MSTESGTRPVTDPLSIVALETERHVSLSGWDQPVRLFALVATAHLLEHEPGFLDTLAPHAAPPGALPCLRAPSTPRPRTRGRSASSRRRSRTTWRA